MIVGCYTLHLYCECSECLRDGTEQFFREFIGETFSQCKRSAKKDGWKFKGESFVYAPGHTPPPTEAR